MHVLLITTDIDRAETYLFLNLHKEGIRLHVICDPHSASILIFKQADIHTTPIAFTNRFQISAIRKIKAILSKQPFDIVHVLRKQALSNTIQAARHFPVKIVAYRGIIGNLSTLDPLSWLTFLHPRVGRVICVAEAIRHFFLKLGIPGLRLPEKKFVTIHKGHDVNWYQRPSPPDLTPFGIPNGVPLVGSVANFRPRKGADILIKAFDSLARTSPAHLVLVGRIKGGKIHRIHRQSPYKARIHLLGFQPDAWILDKAFSVFVVPSLRREGLPRALIEAMAQGVPPVVTDVGGSPEVVEHDLSGLVVPPKNPQMLADAITKILHDRSLAKRFSKNAVKRIQDDFNPQKTLYLTKAVYSELLNEGRIFGKRI